MTGSDIADRAIRVAPLWTLFGAVFIAIFLVFGIAFALADFSRTALSDNASALTAPGYQAAVALDGLAWIVIGATLWILAMMAYSTAGLRSRLAASSGVATAVLGSLGGFIRLTLVPYLASQYVGASPTQQTALVVSFHAVQGLWAAAFTAGQFFQVTGFLFAGAGLLTIPGFPRWLAGWTLFPSATAGALFVSDLVYLGAPPGFFVPVLLVHILVGTLGLLLALTIGLWRFRPAPRSPTGPASEG